MSLDFNCAVRTFLQTIAPLWMDECELFLEPKFIPREDHSDFFVDDEEFNKYEKWTKLFKEYMYNIPHNDNKCVKICKEKMINLLKQDDKNREKNYDNVAGNYKRKAIEDALNKDQDLKKLCKPFSGKDSNTGFIPLRFLDTVLDIVARASKTCNTSNEI